MSEGRYDFAVIGAGIAGASVAFELADGFRVLLAEAEPQPGMHSTGRSAALFSEIYGGAEIRALSRASRAFLSTPPGGFADAPLIHRRGSLFLALAGRGEALRVWRDDPHIAAGTGLLSADQAAAIVPILRRGRVELAAFEPDAHDIDVDALLQGYLRGFRRRGGVLRLGARLRALDRSASGWTLTLGEDAVEAAVVVNAAGAWADAVGRLAGAAPVGLIPRRRTAILTAPPPHCRIDGWPLVIDFDESFYFKPDAGQLLISPADETPVEAGDAQPEEIDVATAAYRFEEVADHRIAHIRHRWAGLRSFVADRVPVIGFDGKVEGLFWLAGQGGYGIQTAPAAARLAAALASGRAAPSDIMEQGLDLSRLRPSRLRGTIAADGREVRGSAEPA